MSKKVINQQTFAKQNDLASLTKTVIPATAAIVVAAAAAAATTTTSFTTIANGRVSIGSTVCAAQGHSVCGGVSGCHG